MSNPAAVRYQKGLIAQGLCPHCRQATEVNPKTGKPYVYCFTERERRRLHRMEHYYRHKPRKTAR